MTTHVSLLLVAVVVCAIVVFGLCSNRCRHVDQDGRSFLQWAWRQGRLQGWCPLCTRFTSGWVSPRPQYDRLPTARIATVEEVARFRAQRAARCRLQQRMRTA